MIKIKQIKAQGLLLITTLMIFSSSLFASTTSDGNTNEAKVDTAEVLTMAEVMPEIQGGIVELYKHIEYPKSASLNNIQGRVFIRFIVDENGDVQEPEILKDIGGGCGEAAIEGIKNVKFTPGKQNGKPVSVYFTLPITFKLKG